MTDAPDIEQEPDPKPVPATESWKQMLVMRKPGHMEPNSLANMVTILAHDRKWKGVFALDEFSGEIMMHKCAPWLDDSAFRVHRLTHHDIVMTAAALEYDGLTSSVSRTTDAIKSAARQNPVHPVREYFNALTWDGDARLDTWLIDYLGATEQDANYIGPVGAKWLIAGVKRVFQPGAKFDFMLVLEGPQNIGKSLALRTLATFGRDVEEEFFTDAVRFENITHPSSIMALQGKLIIEFAELSGLNRKEIEDIKNWITIQKDELQQKYENAISVFPRQFILAGTTNEDAWLRDPTGNRRFVPVKCPNKINVTALRRDREQLWAEAVYRFKGGEDVMIDHGSELERLAESEQAARLIEDVWTDSVMKFVQDLKSVTMNEILQGIPVEAGRRDEVAARRIGRILRAAGWLRGQLWENGRNKKIWINPAKTMPVPVTASLKLDGTAWDIPDDQPT